MTASTLVRHHPDQLLRQLQDELAAALTPERYDPERAMRLQQALIDFRERINRSRRMRRAVLRVASPTERWWS